jgi:hypothetical protein
MKTSSITCVCPQGRPVQNIKASKAQVIPERFNSVSKSQRGPIVSPELVSISHAALVKSSYRSMRD